MTVVAHRALSGSDLRARFSLSANPGPSDIWHQHQGARKCKDAVNIDHPSCVPPIATGSNRVSIVAAPTWSNWHDQQSPRHHRARDCHPRFRRHDPDRRSPRVTKAPTYEVKSLDHTITVARDDEIVAHILWKHEYDHIYIESIKALDDCKALALMLTKFRGRFRGNTVRFDALDCNEEMQRLVALLKAEPFNKTYSVTI